MFTIGNLKIFSLLLSVYYKHGLCGIISFVSFFSVPVLCRQFSPLLSLILTETVEGYSHFYTDSDIMP